MKLYEYHEERNVCVELRSFSFAHSAILNGTWGRDFVHYVLFDERLRSHGEKYDPNKNPD